MKLHLPTFLRSALLASFTILSPITTTLTTGAFVGGLVTCTLLAPQLFADDSVTIEESDSDFVLGDVTVTSSTWNYVLGQSVNAGTDDAPLYYATAGEVNVQTLTLEGGYLRFGSIGEVATEVVMNGTGEVMLQNDPGTTCSAIFASLKVNDGSYYALYSESAQDSSLGFKTVTGSGNLHINDNALADSTFTVTFDEIVDYTGTIYTAGATGSSFDERLGGTLVISKVSVSSGLTTTLAGDKIHTAGLNFSGAGSLSITGSITYTGESLNMFNEGSLSIDSLTLSGDLTLDYSGTGTLASIGGLADDNTHSLVIDLSGMELGDSFELGLSTDISSDYIDITGLGSDYELSKVDGYWTLVLDGTGGGDEGGGDGDLTLSDAPTTVEIVNSDTAVSIDLLTDYSYENEAGEIITGNYAAVDGVAATTINIIDSAYVRTSFNGDVDTDVYMEYNAGSSVANGNTYLGNNEGDYTYVGFNNLTIKGDSTNILLFQTTEDEMTMSFKSLTGEGNLYLIVSSKIEEAAQANYKLVIGEINNLNGTLRNDTVKEAWHMTSGGQIHISNVVADAGVNTSIAGNIHTAGLNFSGAGSLSITGSLTYTGESLNMFNEGSLSIDSLTLSGDLTLDYSGTGTLASIGGLADDNTHSLVIDLSGIELGDSFELGLSTDISSDYIDITGLGSDYELSKVDGYWTLVLAGTGGGDDLVNPDFVLADATVTNDNWQTVLTQSENAGTENDPIYYVNFEGSNIETLTLEGGYLRYGDLGEVATKIVMQGEGAVSLQNNPGNADQAIFASLTVNDGLYYSLYCEGASGASLGFKTVTGTGNLHIKDNALAESTFTVTIDELVDYTGTIYTAGATGSSYDAELGGTLVISKVSVSSGLTTTLAGDKVYSAGLNFSGAGSLSITGSLTYTGESLNMFNEGSLSIGSLTLSGDLTLDYSGSGTLASIGGLLEGTTVQLVLDLSGVDLGESFDLGLSASISSSLITGFNSEYYTLEQVEGYWTLVLTGELPAPDVEHNWGEGDSLLDSNIVISPDIVVSFTGEGSSDVTVSGQLSLGGITIDTDGDGYTFSGDDASLTTSSLNIEKGSATLDVHLEAEKTLIASEGSLTVNSGINFSSESMHVEGSFSNAGTSQILGSLSMGSGTTLNNTGQLTLGDKSSLGKVEGEGGSLHILENASISIESLSQGNSLNIGTDAQVSIKSDTILSELSSTGSIDMGDNKLSLTGNISQGGSITAGTLDVQASNASLSHVTVGTLVLGYIKQTDSLVRSASQSLVVDSLNSTGDTLTLDLTNIITTNYFEEVTLENGLSYTLVESSDSSESLLGDGLSIGDIIIDAASQGLIDNFASENGFIASVDIDDNNDLVLIFSELESNIWNSSLDYYYDEDGNTVQIFGESGSLADYNVLDKANDININSDSTLSLVGIDPENSQDSVELNNVAGNKTLSLLGDGASEDRFIFVNDKETELNGLIIDKVTVTLNEKLSIENLTTEEGSVLLGTAKLAEDGTAKLEGDLSGLNLIASTGSISINAGSTSINSLKTDGADISIGSSSLTLNSDSVITGGSVNMNINSDELISGSSITIFDGAALEMTGTEIVITDQGSDRNWKELIDVTFTISDNEDSLLSDIEITFAGSSLGSYLDIESNGDGTYTVNFNDQVYVEMASSHNGSAGLNLASSAIFTEYDDSASTEQKSTISLSGSSTESSDIGKVLSALREYKEEGNYQAADKLGAAFAGASTTSLGSALMSDVSRQLGSIRNRTRAMGVNPGFIHENMPYLNAWVSAEGASSTLNSDGTGVGHQLDSVGGSFGIEADINDSLSLGLAYSYLLGDLSANGADNAQGDLDSMYGSIYARINNKRWTHSIIASIGAVDASLERSVSVGNSSYKTKGETEGSSFGLMYEIGYTYALDENAMTCLQPVFNISYVKSSIDGYSETGSDAALRVGKQENNYVSFGLGAVMETVIGENMYNRASVLSTRFMIKADAGDRQAEADVNLLNVAGESQSIKGAERGAVGVELGVGITIPVTDDVGAFFADISCEWRGGVSEVSGSVGYRFSF